jgi:AcrR family transcriptional regulator
VILAAASLRLAKNGPEGLSLSEVANLAGVNRGTAYQHFKTRDALIKEAATWVSNKMFRSVFGELAKGQERKIEEIDAADLADRLTDFAMDNSELCQAWLLHVLSLPNPASDPFWHEYEGSIERFAKTDLAQGNIDPEILSVIILAGTFIWPVWARAHAKSAKQRRELAHRFTQECLRLTMYGSLRPERYPQIAARLAEGHDRSRAKQASRKAKPAS